MKRLLTSAGVKVVINVLFIGNDVTEEEYGGEAHPCFGSASSYRDLAIATGGIFEQLTNGDDEALQRYISHITSSHAARQAKALHMRHRYEGLLEKGQARALPWYSPLSLDEKALIAYDAESSETGDGFAWRGSYVTSSRRSGPGNGAGSIVLEADSIVNPKKTTLKEMIHKKCPELQSQVKQAPGERAYARVKVAFAQEDEVRRCIKKIASSAGKRSKVQVIDQCSALRFTT